MNDKFQHICKYMTGNEVIDRLDDHCGLINNSIHGQVLMDFVDWIELRRLAILGHAAETAPVVNKQIETVCPFCKEDDFDLIGLRTHIVNSWCPAFDKYVDELIIRPTSEPKT